jgi:hypothetical protein
MPCPFPGMDPYLEGPATWPGLHASLIAAAKRHLQPLLLPGYYADIGERLYIEDTQHAIYPDVGVFRVPGSPRGGGGSTATLVADEPTAVITSPARHREPYLEIRATRNHEIVTILEVLSPTNKTPGARGRDEYVRKQEELVRGGVNLVEVDLLRSGAPTVFAAPGTLLALPSYDYMVCVRRVHPETCTQFYAVTLRDRLPRVGVPLRAPDPDVVLDLPAAFAECYEEGAYAYRLDYREPPPLPALRTADAEWLEGRLREAGLRG